MQCGVCESACYEGIDLHDAGGSASFAECTKCFDCVDACPVHAISLPFLPRTRTGGQSERGEEGLCRDSASAAS
jgi:ferredoxin-type protein NapH